MNENTFIEEPTHCPCCSSLLEKVNDQLFCRNLACSAKVLKKIEHFAKVMGIKGLGPKSIEKLQIQEITELYYLDSSEVSSVLGDKIAAKLLDEIERSKLAPLETVLQAFSIPLVGNVASKKLCAVISSIDDISIESCKEANLGEKITSNIIDWYNTEYIEIKEFLPFLFNKTEVKIINKDSKTVCITGKLKSFKNKAEAEVQLKKAGFTVVDSVTKQTNYLIDESDSSSIKREKAEKYGIEIINNIDILLKVN